jgi:competence protein ComEC
MFFKGEIPFVRLLTPLILGIGLALCWPDQLLSRISSAGLVLGLIIFLTLTVVYKSHQVYRRKWIIGILVHFIILLAGYNLTYKNAQLYNADYFTKTPSDALIVVICNEPQLSGEIIKFEARVEQTVAAKAIEPASGKLLVVLKTDPEHPMQLDFGDRLMVPAQYDEVEPPYNPGEFDFKRYLGTRQIYQQAFLRPEAVSVLGHHSGSQLLSFAIALRKKLVVKFSRYLQDQESASLASTLILGYRANLSKEVLSAYSKTGTMHVLSVSGMHVGIIFIVLNFLVRPLRRYKSLRYVNAVIIIALIWFYALITGFSPSVCRAAMMLTFVVLGKALNKNLNTYNLLAISAFFLLLYNPYYLLDIGFQLSYFAVIGLVYFHPKIYNLLYVKNKLLDSIWSYSALSVAAQLATFPLSIYYFHQFPLYFLISNLAIVLPVALIMYAGILFLFIPWPWMLAMLGEFLNVLIRFTNQLLYYIEEMPLASVGGIWINTVQYLLIYLVIATVFWAILSAQKRAVYLGLGCIFLFSLIFSNKTIRNDRKKELIFYSLRKNSAIAYIVNRRAYLVSDLLQDTRTLSYSIYPAIEMNGASIAKRIEFTDTISNEQLMIHSSYLQFGDLKVFRWNQQLNNLDFASLVRADIVLVSGSPKITMDQIREHVRFSLLLIDSSNTDYLIKRWKTEAEALKLNFRILKKQAAYVHEF